MSANKCLKFRFMDRRIENIKRVNVAQLIAERGGEGFLVNLGLQLHREGTNDILLQGGFVIILCKGNGGRVVINGKEYRVEGNNIIVLSENQIVNYIEPILLTENNVIAVVPDYILRLPSPVDTNFFSYSRYVSVITLSDEKFDDLLGYYRFIHKEMHEESRYRREIVGAIFTALILEILAEYERLYNLQPDVEIKDESLSDRFFRLLARHFREEHTVQYYADRLHLTPKYLSTAIKRITGRPILDWIHEALTLEAGMLLRTTDLTVQEVADRLSFSSASAFVQFFKKHTGTTPKRI